MARVFNGTNQSMSRAINLSSFASISLSFWMWWNAFAGDDDLAFEYTANFGTVAGGFLVDPNASNGGRNRFNFGFGNAGGNAWVDEFVRPSAATWHHYVLTMNRATPVNTAYVDGAPQTLFTTQHSVTTYGNFANSTLNFMSRNAAALFGAGRMAEVALWGGTVLTARNALALSTGYSPLRIGPMPIAYWPLLGDTPEPDYSGLQRTLTLMNTPTIANQPPVQGRMAPGRAFQPMPV